MELYTSTSYQLSRQLTLRYSTSFSKSSELFSAVIRPHIFAIYGLVRIADEIVDTYRGKQTARLLDALEEETYASLGLSYSTNPIVHAFAQTANTYGITKQLIAPFFESMRMDLKKKSFTKKEYDRYIYGSAEVIGLMCLRVFVGGNDAAYAKLEDGARALGSAYQKVNFLRDVASDVSERGRVYFPGVDYDTFSEAQKQAIIADIRSDFDQAKLSLAQLPKGAQKAVKLSYEYYNELLRMLDRASIETIKSRRLRVPAARKLALYAKKAVV